MSVTVALAALLEQFVARGGSDLILTTQAPPVMRVQGELVRVGTAALTPSDTEALARELAPTPGEWAEYQRNREQDRAFEWRGHRFRVNLFYQRGTCALVIRRIPTRIPTVGELGLPEGAVGLAGCPRGLVLVTGPTGAGKSTTVVALVNHINTTRGVHIITIEDPVEFVYGHARGVVEQREVGQDTLSFQAALRSALRQNPDVVVLGEMRDLETTITALQVAETGHLVFATLHTGGAAQTVDRVIDIFPPGQKDQVRVQLASVIQGVISQILIPNRAGGRTAAFEIMVATPAVRALIRDGQTQQLRNAMLTGAGAGMMVLEQSLAELVRRGILTLDDALAVANRPQEVEQFLRAPAAGGAPRPRGIGPAVGGP